MQYSPSKLGEIIRKVRKERGLRLEDLADENISPATISNVERGVPHVNVDKALYLLKKLNIGLNEIPAIIMGKQEEIKEINIKFLGVESLFSNGQWEKAIEVLDSLGLEDNHLLAAKAYYLKGKCYIKGLKWKKAERSLHKAIQLASQQRDTENIEAASFSELSYICYHQNNMHQALRFIESGLDAFNGESGSIFWALNLNKAVFLERMSRIRDSMNVVQDVWDSLGTVRESHYILTFYWLRSELLRKMGDFQGCERFALEGIDLARKNYNFNLLFELWTVLGCSYVDQKEWNKAEFCFNQALSLENIQEHKVITACAWLGKLYTVQEKWDEAISVLQKAVSMGEKYNDIPRYSEALQYIGDFHRVKGETDEAIEYYQKVLKLAQKHNLKKKEYIALFHLGQCWEGKNKEEFQQTTINMYEVQKELFEEGAQLVEA